MVAARNVDCFLRLGVVKLLNEDYKYFFINVADVQ